MKKWCLALALLTAVLAPVAAQQTWGDYRNDTSFPGVLIHARCAEDHGSTSTWEWQLKNGYAERVSIFYRVESRSFEERSLLPGQESDVRGLTDVEGGCNRGGLRIAVDRVERQ